MTNASKFFAAVLMTFACAVPAMEINAAPIQIGNALISREDPSNGNANIVMIEYLHGMPSDGFITDFHYFKQSDAARNHTNDGQLHFLILRPTFVSTTTFTLHGQDHVLSRTYDILYRSPSINTGSLANDSVHTFELPSPVAVQAGDVFAHIGRGLPQTFNTQTLNPPTGAPLIHTGGGLGAISIASYLSIANGPATSFTVGTDTAAFNASYRTHSIAVTFEPVPEPGSFALAGLGLISLISLARRRIGWAME